MGHICVEKMKKNNLKTLDVHKSVLYDKKYRRTQKCTTKERK